MKVKNKVLKFFLGYIIVCMIGAIFYFFKNVDRNATNNSSLVIAETEMEYKESCQEYEYKDVLRNIEDYVGKRIKIKVCVLYTYDKTVLSGNDYYYCLSDEDENGVFFENAYVIFDKRTDENIKLLAEDVIIVYGEVIDSKKADKLFLFDADRLCIDMKYAELISE